MELRFEINISSRSNDNITCIKKNNYVQHARGYMSWMMLKISCLILYHSAHDHI